MSVNFWVHYYVCYYIQFFFRIGFFISTHFHQWEGDLNKKSTNENQGPLMNFKMKLKKSIGNTLTRLQIFVDKTGP